jgi:hypothetical protein
MGRVINRSSFAFGTSRCRSTDEKPKAHEEA